MSPNRMLTVFIQRVAPGGTMTGTGAPFPPTSSQGAQEPEEEPEPVRLVNAPHLDSPKPTA